MCPILLLVLGHRCPYPGQVPRVVGVVILGQGALVQHMAVPYAP